MRANEILITELLKKRDVKFVIPVYQRNYNWKQEHCKKLLEDIENVIEKYNTHFIGSIVYLKDGLYTSQEIEEYKIIDGQQRLTTITLIYIVLWKIAKNLNNLDLSTNIYNAYLVEHKKTKLKVTRVLNIDS